MYICVHNKFQFVTEEVQGRYMALKWRVPSAGVSLNYCVKYYIRFYGAFVISLIV